MLILSIILLLSNCGDDEGLNLDHIPVFSNEHFKTYEEYVLHIEDVEISADESVIVAGNGGEEGNPTWIPYVLKIGADKELSDIRFLEFDNQQIYRRTDLFPTQDGNFIYLSNSALNQSSPDIDIDVRKLTAEGEIIWQKRIGEESKKERGVSIVELPNNDFIMLCLDDQVFNTGKYLLVRTTKEGEVIWSKTITDETNISVLRKILYLPDDNSILVLNEHGVGLNLAQNSRIKITKLDVDGNVITTKLVLDDTGYWPFSSNMKVLYDGTILIYFTSYEEGTTGDQGINMLELNGDLSEVWNRRYEEIENDLVSDIVVTSEDEYLMLSMSTQIGNGEFDIILSKIDKAGTIIWRKVFGSTSSDFGRRIYEKLNNNILIIGATNHTTGSESIFDLFLLETDSVGNPL